MVFNELVELAVLIVLSIFYYSMIYYNEHILEDVGAYLQAGPLPAYPPYPPYPAYPTYPPYFDFPIKTFPSLPSYPVFPKYPNYPAYPLLPLKYRSGEESAQHNMQFIKMMHCHMMMAVGFGLLMTFLSLYGFTGRTMVCLLMCIPYMLALMIYDLGYFGGARTPNFYDWMHILSWCSWMTMMMLVSLGAVLGRMTLRQMIAMSALETLFGYMNYDLCITRYHLADTGGALVIFTFGGLYGICVGIGIGNKLKGNCDADRYKRLKRSSYSSDVHSFMGAGLMLALWPSYNSLFIYAPEEEHRAMINTFLSICGAVVGVFTIGALVGRSSRIRMFHVRHGVLSGGVVMGCLANIIIVPFAAVICGFIAGGLTVIGFRYIRPRLRGVIRDTSAVLFTFCLPGILSLILSLIFITMADTSDYGDSLNHVFPKVAAGGSMRNQVKSQLQALGVTLLSSIVTGLVSGIIIKVCFKKLRRVQEYNDEREWVVR